MELDICGKLVETVTTKAKAEFIKAQELAQLLFISEGTAKNHITNILSKLGLRDRTQIALYAYKKMDN